MVILEKKKINLILPSQEGVPGQNINIALGQYGINIVKFLKDFNDLSLKFPSGMLLCVLVEVSGDSSFEIKIKGPSVLYLIKCLLNNKQKIFLKRKDLLLLLFFIRKYRKDLSFFSDISLCRSFIGIFRSYNLYFENAFIE